MSTKKRKYTPEFKKEAVKLSYEIGVEDAAIKLGIPVGNVNRWRYSKKSGVTEKSNDYLSLQAEVRKLKKQLAEEKEINEILKKTTAYFSQITKK